MTHRGRNEIFDSLFALSGYFVVVFFIKELFARQCDKIRAALQDKRAPVSKCHLYSLSKELLQHMNHPCLILCM